MFNMNTMKKNNKKKSSDLIGRDPTCGRLAFRTGRIETQKDKLRRRNSKLTRKLKRNNYEE